MLKRIALALLLLLTGPRLASADALRFENLWPFPGTDLSTVILSLTPQGGGPGRQLLSADYGILDPSFQIGIPIIAADPISPGESRLVELPSILDGGFIFSNLDVSGPCPNNCGWGTANTDVLPGTFIGPGDVINVLWPAVGGGFVPVVRVTFVDEVPEPAMLSLLALGAVGGLQRWRRRVPR